MNKEDYYKRIEDKMDKQTVMLININTEVNKKFSLLELAHQKLKFGVIGLTILVMVLISSDYPKIAAVLTKMI